MKKTSLYIDPEVDRALERRAVAETVKTATEHQGIGLPDASLLVPASRSGTTRVATLEEPHFRSLRPLTGEPAFLLLPADA